AFLIKFKPGLALATLKVKVLTLTSKSLEQQSLFLFINRPSNKIIRWLLRFGTRFRLIAPNPIGANPSGLKRDGFLFWQHIALLTSLNKFAVTKRGRHAL